MDKKEGKIKLVRCFFILVIVVGLSVGVSAISGSYAEGMEIIGDIKFVDTDGDQIPDDEDCDDDNDEICDVAPAKPTCPGGGYNNGCRLCLIADKTTPIKSGSTIMKVKECATDNCCADDDANGNGIADLQETTDTLPGAESLGCFYKFGLAYAKGRNTDKSVSLTYPSGIYWYGDNYKIDPVTGAGIPGVGCKDISLMKVYNSTATLIGSMDSYIPYLTEGPPFSSFLGTKYYYSSGAVPLCPAGAINEGYYWIYGNLMDKYNIPETTWFRSPAWFPNSKSPGGTNWGGNWVGGPEGLTTGGITLKWQEGVHYLYNVSWDDDRNDCDCLMFNKGKIILVATVNCGLALTQGIEGEGTSCETYCKKEGFGSSRILYCTSDEPAGGESYEVRSLTNLPKKEGMKNLVCMCDFWDIGGEAQETKDKDDKPVVDKCCGDEEGEEFPISSTILKDDGTEVFPDFDFIACCGPDEGGTESNKCAFDDICYPDYTRGATTTSVPEESKLFLGGELYVCKENEWIGPDQDSTICAGLGGGVGYIGSDTKPKPDTSFCCGNDDARMPIHHSEEEGKFTGLEGYVTYPILEDVVTPAAVKYIISARVKSGETKGVSFTLGLSRGDYGQPVVEKSFTATTEWQEFTVSGNLKKGTTKIYIALPKTKDSIIVDDVQVLGPNPNYDSGNIGVSADGDEMLCVECTKENKVFCPEGMNKDLWHQQPPTQSYLLHTVDMKAIGEQNYDLISNGNEWYYCNADGSLSFTGNRDRAKPVGDLSTFDKFVSEREPVDGRIACPLSFRVDKYTKYYRPGRRRECQKTATLDKDCPDVCHYDWLSTHDRGNVEVDDIKKSEYRGEPYDETTRCLYECAITEISEEDRTTETGRAAEDLILKSDCINEKIESCLKTYGLGDTRQTCDELTETTGDVRVCTDKQACIGGNLIIAKDTTSCCLGDNAFCSSGDPKEPCADQSGTDCPESLGFTCEGKIVKAIDSSNCCVGGCAINIRKITSVPSFVADNTESFKCYMENGNNYFAECCSDRKCYNSLRLREEETSGQFSVFGAGGALHTITGFDFLEDGKLVDYVQRYREYGPGDTIFIEVFPAKRDWSKFGYLEFDMVYSEYSTYKIKINGAGGASVLGETDIHKYSTNGIIPKRWHHYRIPLGGLSNLNIADRIEIDIPAEAPKVDIAIDNIKLTGHSGKNSETRYCTGKFGVWLAGLEIEDEPSGYTSIDITGTTVDEDALAHGVACNAQLSFGFTGERCCGDDNKCDDTEGCDWSDFVKEVNSKTAVKEFYTDSLAGCFAGFVVKPNQKVSDSMRTLEFENIMYSADEKFVQCKGTADFGSGGNEITTIPTTEECQIEGNLYCSFDLNQYNENRWKDKYANEDYVEGDDLLEKPRDTPKKAVVSGDGDMIFGLAKGKYPDFERVDACCPVDMCWNGELCVDLAKLEGTRDDHPKNGIYVCNSTAVPIKRKPSCAFIGGSCTSGTSCDTNAGEIKITGAECQTGKVCCVSKAKATCAEIGGSCKPNAGEKEIELKGPEGCIAENECYYQSYGAGWDECGATKRCNIYDEAGKKLFCDFDDYWKNAGKNGYYAEKTPLDAGDLRDTEKSVYYLFRDDFEAGNTWSDGKIRETEKEGKTIKYLDSKKDDNTQTIPTKTLLLKSGISYLLTGEYGPNSKILISATGLSESRKSEDIAVSSIYFELKFTLPILDGPDTKVEVDIKLERGTLSEIGLMSLDEPSISYKIDDEDYSDSCCPNDMCWNGKKCVGSVEEPLSKSLYDGPPSTSESFSEGWKATYQWVCLHTPDDITTPDEDEEKAEWNFYTLKKLWDETSLGYCAENQCWNGERCVDSGWYTNKTSIPDFATAGDHYCEDVGGVGKWTSRTKLVAEAMMGIGESNGEDYMLVCDDQVSIKDYTYATELITRLSETDFEKYPLCVLRKGTETLDAEGKYRTVSDEVYAGILLDSQDDIEDLLKNKLKLATGTPGLITQADDEFYPVTGISGINTVYNPKNNLLIFSEQIITPPSYGDVGDLFTKKMINVLKAETTEPKITKEELEAIKDYKKIFIRAEYDSVNEIYDYELSLKDDPLDTEKEFVIIYHIGDVCEEDEIKELDYTNCITGSSSFIVRRELIDELWKDVPGKFGTSYDCAFQTGYHSSAIAPDIVDMEKEYMLYENKVEVGCCPEDQCWNGEECVASVLEPFDMATANKDSYSQDLDEYDSTKDMYVCTPRKISGKTEAVWYKVLYKQNWDKTDEGYCLLDSYCWTGAECVDGGWYTQKVSEVQTEKRYCKNKGEDEVCTSDNECDIAEKCEGTASKKCICKYVIINPSIGIDGDHYCEVEDEIGRWTTRTKLMAEALLGVAGDDDYRLVCEEDTPRLTTDILTTVDSDSEVKKYGVCVLSRGTEVKEDSVIVEDGFPKYQKVTDSIYAGVILDSETAIDGLFNNDLKLNVNVDFPSDGEGFEDIVSGTTSDVDAYYDFDKDILIFSKETMATAPTYDEDVDSLFADMKMDEEVADVEKKEFDAIKDFGNIMLVRKEGDYIVGALVDNPLSSSDGNFIVMDYPENKVCNDLEDPPAMQFSCEHKDSSSILVDRREHGSYGLSTLWNNVPGRFGKYYDCGFQLKSYRPSAAYQDLDTDKEYLIYDNPIDVGCCLAGKCWDGKECIDGVLEPFTTATAKRTAYSTGKVEDRGDHFDSFACTTYNKDYRWAGVYYKQKWDETGEGYCHTEDQCWTGAECVDSAWYTEEVSEADTEKRYCPNKGKDCPEGDECTGELESCGTDDKCACSYETPITNPNKDEGDHLCEEGEWTSRTKYIAETLLDYAGIGGEIATDYTLYCDKYDNVLNKYDEGELATTLSDGATTNFCVIQYEQTNDEVKTIFGVGLNQELGNAVYKDFREELGDPDCSSAIKHVSAEEDGEFKACEENKLWYNNELKIAIFSESEIASIEHKFLEEFFANPFKALFDLVTGIVTREEEITGYDFITEAKDFAQTYINIKTIAGQKKEVRGVIERLILKEADDTDYKNVMTVRYKGYTVTDLEDACENIHGDIKCMAEGGDLIIFSETQVKIDEFWPQITARIRTDIVRIAGLRMTGAANFDGSGNLILRGTLTKNTDCTSDDKVDEFVIKDAGDTILAVIKLDTGDMCIKGLLNENMGELSPKGKDDFIVKDNDGFVVGFIDELGNLYIKGELIENSQALR